MKVSGDLLIEVHSLHKDEYVTHARQILRDDVYREIYITDEKGHLTGMIDITDVLKVTDTRSNVTISGFIREAPSVAMDTSLETVGSVILKAGTDSVSVLKENVYSSEQFCSGTSFRFWYHAMRSPETFAMR
jgi:CBS domain.